jgi:ubiquinone/menaquinone biosynthesis C-methylase UbiE
LDLRTWLCFTLSRKLMRPPETRTVDYGDYQGWRDSSLTQSWDAFDDAYVRGKDVLDFGCGDGPLALYLAREKAPRRIVGVDLGAQAIERANQAKAHARLPANVEVEFIVGSSERLPVPDSSFDTLLAFDCFEHVMAPGPILRDWARVLRPGGRCLIEWFPYKGTSCSASARCSAAPS